MNRHRIGDAYEQTVDIERIDWSMCFLCQNTNKNKMEMLRPTETSIKKISEQLHKFAEIIEHKIFQWFYLLKFGIPMYFPMLGAVHIEKALLIVHSKLCWYRY